MHFVVSFTLIVAPNLYVRGRLLILRSLWQRELLTPTEDTLRL